MDDIEVKLDEINAKIDQIAYAPKYKASYEIEEMMKSKASGGFMDTLIKGAAGRGALGGIGAGVVAGGTAGGILVLADVIAGLTKQSKILSEVQSNLTKSVSLLVDLVLLPFLPLIFGAIILLYSGIVGFGTWWKDVWETLKKEGLIGLVKLGLQWGMDTLADWQKRLTEWLFSDKPLGEKTVDLLLALGTLAGGFFAFLGDKVIGLILDFIFGQGSYDKAKQAVFNIAAGILDGGIKIITAILDFIFGDGTARQNALDFTINLLKGAGDWLWNIMAGIYNTGAGIVDSIVNPSSKSSATGDMGLKKPFSSANTTANSIQVTNNFNGFTIDQLPGMVDNALRQAGDRLSSGSGW